MKNDRLLLVETCSFRSSWNKNKNHKNKNINVAISAWRDYRWYGTHWSVQNFFKVRYYIIISVYFLLL